MMLDSQNEKWYNRVHWVSKGSRPGKKTTTPEQNKKLSPANADARKIKEDYPERMLDTRFAQPKWTTVLL